MTFATKNQKFINTTHFLFLLVRLVTFTQEQQHKKKTRGAKADIKSVKFNQIYIFFFLSDPLIKE